jgi:hypothetical protein
LFALLSQLPKPALHWVRLQDPDTQASLALAMSHTSLHALQSVTVLSGRSHPLFALLSQLPKPGLHEPITHEPVLHDAPALERLQV